MTLAVAHRLLERCSRAVTGRRCASWSSGFHSGDLGENARNVIVNESFVESVLGGRNPIGRRIRYRLFEESREPLHRESQPWYEIVGVVPDLGLSWSDFDPKSAGIYHAVPPGGVYPMHMAVQIAGEPGALVHDMRAVAAIVDPALRLYDAVPVPELDDSELRFYSFDAVSPHCFHRADPAIFQSC